MIWCERGEIENQNDKKKGGVKICFIGRPSQSG